MKHSVPAQTENDLIDFYRNAIRTRSYSNHLSLTPKSLGP